MSSKSDQTKSFIIETAAPIFNKFGYAATALSDITKATGLTKGAVYGNFKNKEEIALEAFNYNMKLLLKAISKKMEAENASVNKLYALTAFFRDYHKLISEFGGCPILNIGIDSKHQNPVLHERVKYSIKEIIKYITAVIEKGIEQKEIKQTVDAEQYAKQILTLIEGSVFMMSTLNEKKYLSDMMDHADQLIRTEMEI